MGIRSSKDILVFPEGIIKIIKEYCSYTRVFKKELLVSTVSINHDSNKNWCYSDYFINHETKSVLRSKSGIKRNGRSWSICSYD